MSNKALRVSILGGGTVGGGIVDLLSKNQDLIRRAIGRDLVPHRVLVRDLSKPRNIPADLLTDDPNLALQGADLVAEVMGGDTTALELVRQALKAKQPVATANKMMVATHGAALLSLSEETGTGFRYEASVAGGIPILDTLSGILRGNRFSSLEGIVNGTTHYILTRMAEEGLAYEAVLEQAQKLGYAEADPSSDVDGWDAVYKLVILVFVVTGQWLNPLEIEREGLGRATELVRTAQQSGKVVKLIARADLEQGRFSVRPEMLHLSHPLARLRGVENGIRAVAQPVGELFWSGPGAGAGPTASSVVGDLIKLAEQM